VVFASAIAAVAQQQPVDPIRTPGVQAGRDPNRAAFVAANCRTQPAPAAAPAAGGNAARGGGAAANAGRGTRGGQPVAFANAGVAAIPGVIAAGQRWRLIWEGSGNNTDSPIATDKGILLAMNDLSQIIEISLDGRVEVIATDTYTGGALALTPDGTLYVGERALNRGIWQVRPRRLFTNTMNGEPLECLGPGVLNDMVAVERRFRTRVSASASLATATAISASRVNRGSVRAETASPPTKAKTWRVSVRSPQI
jgi:hypothetical protein